MLRGLAACFLCSLTVMASVQELENDGYKRVQYNRVFLEACTQLFSDLTDAAMLMVFMRDGYTQSAIWHCIRNSRDVDACRGLVKLKPWLESELRALSKLTDPDRHSGISDYHEITLDNLPHLGIISMAHIRQHAHIAAVVKSGVAHADTLLHEASQFLYIKIATIAKIADVMPWWRERILAHLLLRKFVLPLHIENMTLQR